MIYFNGKFEADDIKIDYNDRGYQFGDGIYEVVRVYDGKLFTAREHFERLVRSANEILMKSPHTVDEYISICDRLIQENNIVNGNIYIQVTRGVAKRNHAFPLPETEPVTLMYTNHSERPLDGMTNGVKTITADDIRWLRCDIKSLNLLGNVLNKEKAVRSGAVEAVQVRDGVVTEGASSNVYIVKDGTIYTHPANHLILNGITRQVIKSCAAELNVPFKEETFGVEELFAADEIFISSTTLEVTPVNQVDEQHFEVGLITKQLQEKFEAQIK